LKKLKKRTGGERKELRGLAEELLKTWPDGRIKLYIIFQVLNHRRENSSLYSQGLYLPLSTEGKLKKNICAFARQRDGRTALAIAPRLLAGLGLVPEVRPLGRVWEDCRLLIPEEVTGSRFYNLFTGETVQVVEGDGRRFLALEEVLAFFPLALLTPEWA
jgi:(1->4)-alpha-D-glucan 1-alpha-D-glucosylmutase